MFCGGKKSGEVAAVRGQIWRWNINVRDLLVTNRLRGRSKKGPSLPTAIIVQLVDEITTAIEGSQVARMQSQHQFNLTNNNHRNKYGLHRRLTLNRESRKRHMSTMKSKQQGELLRVDKTMPSYKLT
jgi:hypothetical protein